MAFVLLPCDLPCWPAITRLLVSLGGATSPGQVGHVLRSLHDLTDVSLEPGPGEDGGGDGGEGDGGVDAVVGAVEQFLQEEGEGLGVWKVALPSLLAAALALKDLKPPHGLTYSLQQQGGEVVVGRGLASSLLAHMFLGTLPRRCLLTHPTLTDPSLAPTLAALHRESQRAKMRAFFNYFTVLAREGCSGNITFCRRVMGGREWVRLREWAGSGAALCGVEVRREGGVLAAPPILGPHLVTTFTTPDPARPALTPTASQAAGVLSASWEVVVAAVMVEQMEDNEALQVVDALTLQPSAPAAPLPQVTRDLAHVLVDADDYRASELVQYEEVNVLRELNKARLGFHQQDLPPNPPPRPANPAPPHSSDSSEIISVSRQGSGGSSGGRLEGRDVHLTSQDGRQCQQTSDVTGGGGANDVNKEKTGKADKREMKVNEREAKTEHEKTEGKQIETEEIEAKREEKDTNEEERELQKNQGVRKEVREVKESDNNETESEAKSDKASVRRKTSITQRIKGMLKKTDAKHKDKGNRADNKEETRRLITLSKYRKGKNKAKGDRQKGGSATDSRADTEDDSAAHSATGRVKQAEAPRGSAGEKESQQKSPALHRKVPDQQAAQQPKSTGGKSSAEQDSADDRTSALRQQTAAQTDAKPSTQPQPKSAELAKPITSRSATRHRDSAGGSQAGSAGSSYVTANSTLRHPPRKPRLTRTKHLETFPPACDPATPKSAQGHGEVSATQHASKDSQDLGESMQTDDDDDDTTKLLNRVLRAIQKLEKERPELVQEARMEADSPRSPHIPARPSGPQGRPPLPDGVRGGVRGRGDEERRRRAALEEEEDKGMRRRRRLEGEGLRNLSQYYSCSEDLPSPLSSRPPLSPLASRPPLSPLSPSHPRSFPLLPPRPQPSEDDQYFSACESLEEKAPASPRPKRPSRRRSKKSARKSSFAERLKEAIAREPSPDPRANLPLRTRVSRQESAGFVLDHNLPQSFSREEEGEEEEEEEEEGSEEEEEEGGEKEKTCSSRYSFSSDYSSELEGVYEELGDALESLEGGEHQGPRAAALTRLARGVLKRGLSESYKDVPLGLDGTTLRGRGGGLAGGGEPLLPRSLSLSDRHRPPSPAAPTAASRDAKGRRGKAVVTGNWGCGSLKGDPQLKAMIQWAAASQAGAPRLIYCCYGNPHLVKLDTVFRLVGDRGWTVGELVTTVLHYCAARLALAHGTETELTESADSSLPEALRYRAAGVEGGGSLFDHLIGRERPQGGLETEL